jgi:hypothetical protein
MSNVFSPILKALDKNNNVFIDAMEHINVTQLESEKYRSKIQKRETNKYLLHLISINKMIHLTSKNMLSVLANFNIVMCHIFIQDKAEMPLIVNILFDSLEDENPRANIHVCDE